MTNGDDCRSQTLVGRSGAEAGVAHDVNGTEVEARVHVREAGKVEVDPCQGRCVTRVSEPRRAGSNVKVLNDDSIDDALDPSTSPSPVRGGDDTPDVKGEDVMYVKLR